MSSGFDVVPTPADGWRDLRTLRLEMLADTPKAFLESLKTARETTDEQWQARIARYTAQGSCALVAIEHGSGRWIGTMSAFVDVEADRAWLVAVYVAPAHRGRAAGVADALLDGVERWVRERGRDRLWLLVHEDNPRAHAFYVRRGYEFTGDTTPYALDAGERELEMVRSL